MTERAVLTLVCLVTVMTVPHSARGDDRPSRIWILPFEHSQSDPSLDYLEAALPALLAVAVSGSDQHHSVVDRQHLNTVLAEQSLTLEGLTSTDTRHRIGKLLGATAMITGSFVQHEQQLLLTMRATDLETGIMTVTAEGRGATRRLGELVTTLYRRLAGDLGKRLPDLAPAQIDEAPLANLHFMKGLGHYHSARYNHAIAEFMLAAEDRQFPDVARLWIANAYWAQQHYGHACLELSRLEHGGSKHVLEKLRACEQHLPPEDMKIIRKLIERRAPTTK